MYRNCGAFKEALALFASLRQRHVYSWNFIIGAYARQGQGWEALQLFNQMQHEGIMPEKITFISILDACAIAEALAVGAQMHVRIRGSGLESDVVVGTALVNMYGKCGCPNEALKVFEKLSERDVVAWTAMITVCAQHGHGNEAIQLFDQMQQQAEMPNRVTFLNILAAYGSPSAQPDCRRMHARMWNIISESDVVVWNAVIKMYNKCGSLEHAWRMFDNMPKRDVISWNCMIAACVQQKEAKEAILFFNKMQHEAIMPDKCSLVSIIDACSKHQSLAEGVRMHARISHCSFEPDVVVGNALVNMYSKFGSLKDAWCIFGRMPEQNVVSWSTIIGMYAQHGQSQKAQQLIGEMLQGGVRPNNVTFICILSAFSTHSELTEARQMHGCIVGCGFDSDLALGNALITMYGKCCSLEDAQEVFEKMRQRNVISWTAMIAVCSEHGHFKKSLQLFEEMQLKGIKPNQVTLITTIAVCASLAALAEGKKIHASVAANCFESDVMVMTALVNMYGKCGSLDDAWMAFDNILKRDVIFWNALIAVCAQHGQNKEVLQFFDQMMQQGVMPDKVTFVSILAACSHAGLLSEGCHFFSSMNHDHGIPPTMDHYVCMIDLLGRAGMLDEAEHLISEMPFQPTAVPLTALLWACIYQSDVERGERVAKRASALEPESAAPYVLLSNIYAIAGRDDDAMMLISNMKEKGLKPQEGCFIEPGCIVNELFIEDQFISSQDDIYAGLHRLNG